MTRRQHSLLVCSLVCIGLPLGAIPFEWLSLSRHWTGGPVWLLDLVLIVSGLLSLIFILALCAIPFRKLRRGALGVAVCCFCFIGTSIIAMLLGERLQKNAFARAANGSKPLIDAIRKYEKDHSHPPDNLDVLVPEYLPFLPTTGIGTSPRFKYRVAATNYHNPWVLEIPLSSTGLDFGSLIYLPLTNYQSLWFAQKLQPVGDWVFFYVD